MLPRAGGWSASQFYTIAFGQGLSLNAVQAASVYATIANGGVRVAAPLVAGHDGAGRHVHPGGRADGDPGGQRADRRRGAAMLERVVSERGHRPDGADPRLPRRGQDRNGATASTTPAAATAATPRRSSAWPRPTSPRSSSR